MFEKEKKRKLAIKCLRNKVETLKKELVTKEHSLRKEKEEAVSRVRSFRRDSLMEAHVEARWLKQHYKRSE